MNGIVATRHWFEPYGTNLSGTGLTILAVNHFNHINGIGTNYFQYFIYFEAIKTWEDLWHKDPKYIVFNCSGQATQNWVSDYNFQWRELNVATYTGVSIKAQCSGNYWDTLGNYLNSFEAQAASHACTDSNKVTFPDATDYITGNAGGRFQCLFTTVGGVDYVTQLVNWGNYTHYKFLSDWKQGSTTGSPYYIVNSESPYTGHQFELDIGQTYAYNALYCQVGEDGISTNVKVPTKNFGLKFVLGNYQSMAGFTVPSRESKLDQIIARAYKSANAMHKAALTQRQLQLTGKS